MGKRIKRKRISKKIKNIYKDPIFAQRRRDCWFWALAVISFIAGLVTALLCGYSHTAEKQLKIYENDPDWPDWRSKYYSKSKENGLLAGTIIGSIAAFIGFVSLFYTYGNCAESNLIIFHKYPQIGLSDRMIATAILYS
jgi:hypothetical protein